MSLLTYNVCGSGMFTAEHPSRHPLPPWGAHRPRRSTVVAQARKGLSSRTRRLDNRGKKGAVTPTKEEEEEAAVERERLVIEERFSSLEGVGGGVERYSTEPMPEMQGDEPDFWEGPQWNALGFFIQYQWAFGIVFALVACVIAVSTYNEGATDFKQTPVYKESIQSQELLEEPEASNSDVFEANPTEEAPSLE